MLDIDILEKCLPLTKQEVIKITSSKEFRDATFISGEFKKDKGDNYFVECCFHGENVPSLSINFRTSMWHCFGCGDKGDIFTFYGKLHGLDAKAKADFPKILEGIANDFGIELEAKK